MSIPEKIGRNIVFLRKKKGITQEWLALESETAISYLRSIEYGRANPSVEVLARISQVLEVPLEVLVSEEFFEQYASRSVQEQSAMSFSEVIFWYRFSALPLCQHCREEIQKEYQHLSEMKKGRK